MIFCSTFGWLCSRLVIKTLKETDQERKCFRLVGGVLLEKTVKDVVPTLETSVQGVSGRVTL
jgi:prefoldin subunit 2